MQLQSMHNKPKLIVGINVIWFYNISIGGYLYLLYINCVVYAGIVSMTPFLLLFQLSILCCLIASKTEKFKMQLLLTIFIIVCMEIILFHTYSPKYSVSKAISTIQQLNKNLIVTQNKNYTIMSTTTHLNPLINRGYIFNCIDTCSDNQYNVFFNPEPPGGQGCRLFYWVHWLN